MTTAERDRLAADARSWARWGPYLAERARGTVREDGQPGGAAWEDFPHDHARSRAYRWNEDGFGGICDGQRPGDTGAGLGASHQTGWTGLVADLLLRRA